MDHDIGELGVVVDRNVDLERIAVCEKSP